MEIQDVEKIVEHIFKGKEVDHIADYDDYFVVTLRNAPLDGTHMINKKTGEVRPYNPILMKGNKQ